VAYNRKDYYFNKAKKQNFAARSVYKLEEINKRLRIIKGGDQILDLGAAPGSWSQYCSAAIGPAGRVLGIDLQKIEISLPNGHFVQGDIHEANWPELIAQFGLKEKFEVVISDMAPNTTGIKITDQARSLELCEMAFQAACDFLKPGGHFVCKVFESGDTKAFRDKVGMRFKKIEIIRPKSTRKESIEFFLIGISFIAD